VEREPDEVMSKAKVEEAADEAPGEDMSNAVAAVVEG